MKPSRTMWAFLVTETTPTPAMSLTSESLSLLELPPSSKTKFNQRNEKIKTVKQDKIIKID